MHTCFAHKKFLILQLNQPTRGDWALQIRTDLKELDITESFEELNVFIEKIKLQIQQHALVYLLVKRVTKGKEIEYKKLEMAEYLKPRNRKMNIERYKG